MFTEFTPKFIDRYKNLQPKWGFNGLGYIVMKRSYARRIENRTEEWFEIVKRVIESAQEIGAKYTVEEAERLYDHVFNLRCNFAGRALWQLGTDTVRKFGGNSLINCLKYDTKILTENGIVKIGDISGTVQRVMTEYGKWQDAEIRNFGKQKLKKITLSYGGNIKKEIYATSEHRWFRKPYRGDGERNLYKKIEVNTSELQSGDYLISTFGQSVKNILEISRYGILHGLVFGDGSVLNNVGTLTLCGDKNKELLYLFENDKKYNLSNEDIRITNLPSYFKLKPSIGMDKGYLYGWLAGYFAADGCISDDGEIAISSSKKDNLEFVRDVCSKLGIFAHDIKVQYRIGIGQTEESPIYKVTINGNFIDERFFLIKKHKERFLKHAYNKVRNWKVVSISDTDIEEDVYCATVPETHSFVLDGNILTGNCYGVSITKLEDFLFIFENLMLGGGVGFSVRKEDIYQLPTVKESVIIKHFNTKDADFIVPDSREGWIYLLDKVLKSYFYSGKSFTYSTILIRPKGELIKTFGGISAGPKILYDGIHKITNILDSRSGKKLRSVDVLDIANLIAEIVISGNVRRSAELAIGDVDDILYLKSKRWDTGKIPNWRAMSNNSVECNDFNDIQPIFWEGYKGNGEPYGLFNLKLIRKFGRLGEENKDTEIEIVNPCLGGDTIIATLNGPKTFEELSENGKDIEVYSWDPKTKVPVIRTMRNPRKTKKDVRILEVEFDSGLKVKCTPDHNFYSFRGDKIQSQQLVVGQSVRAWSMSQHGFDGTCKNHKIVSIKEAGTADVYNGTVDDSHSYIILDPNPVAGIMSGIVSANCGELPLENRGVCNLSELYMNNIHDKETMLDCAKLLYKYQKALCNINYIHKETTHWANKNNRIGLGVTGILQNKKALDENWYDYTYKELRKFDKKWSKENEWNESIRLTTIKPSGSLSLLSGSTPGIHPAYSKYYIRRVEMSSNDPVVEYCRNLGCKIEYRKQFDGTDDRLTVKVEFPCYVGDDTPTSKDLTAIELLEYVKLMQKIWADNAVSVTCYYKKEELSEIKKWLKKNYNNNIKTISFLLHSDHGFIQPPYEPITKEVYEELSSKIKEVKPINEDTTQSELDYSLECDAAGACPIR